MEKLTEFYDEIQKGNRTMLSRAITLAESSIPEDQYLAQLLIQKLLPKTGNSRRIAITGVPGVGKSTFIESFGKILTEKGKNVAVLAIDPSSSLSGGSILGDKTRMEDLARNPHAFIRPSASGGHLGGIASRTYEAMLLCEAAGFDVILIETVGVGQSETLVHDITDLFLFLQIPGTGDDLQGIKRGIMEMSDIIFVNKSDEFGVDKAKEVKVTLARVMQFLPQKKSGWKRKIVVGSGLTGQGLVELYNWVDEYFLLLNQNGNLEKIRQEQKVKRVKEYIQDSLVAKAMKLYRQNHVEYSSDQHPYWIAEDWIKNELKFNQ